mmetsp:Transcript_16166/g.33351  ORF Transcript_16166/g.33351 Transcript_16166/m.33351 type:complete len:226 (+) Transcript_16166:187-864(+)
MILFSPWFLVGIWIPHAPSGRRNRGRNIGWWWMLLVSAARNSNTASRVVIVGWMVLWMMIPMVRLLLLALWMVFVQASASTANGDVSPSSVLLLRVLVNVLWRRDLQSVWFSGILLAQNAIGQPVGLAIVKHVFRKHLSKGRHVGLVHSHSFQNGVVVIDFKGQTKVKLDVRSIPGHVAIDRGRLVGVDHNKRQRNRFRWNSQLALRGSFRVIPLHQIPKANLLL